MKLTIETITELKKLSFEADNKMQDYLQALNNQQPFDLKEIREIYADLQEAIDRLNNHFEDIEQMLNEEIPMTEREIQNIEINLPPLGDSFYDENL